MTSLLRSLALALLGAVLLLPSAAGAQIPPDERWRVVDTEHFRVHFAPGLEAFAQRAGARADSAYAQLSDAFVRPPRGKIDLVLADNIDYANGFATPFPRNRVVVYAHPPVDDPWLSFYDDWLELVITHELVHTFHLDYARGPLRALRSVLGRNPLTFPGIIVPDWTTEGLATYLESRLTRAGRVRGTMHEMVLRTAVLEDRFFPVDRATGTPERWPAGNTRYVYGSMFLTWLADRRGEEAAGEFVRIYGGRVVPYLVDRAAHQAYGRSFTAAWEEWEDELTARYRREADSLRAIGLTEPEVLTEAGRYVRAPRFLPDGRIVYAHSTGRDDPSTRVIEPGGTVRVLAPRTTLAPAEGGARLYTTMLEAADPYRYYSEVYALDSAGADQDRLTRRRRWTDVDVGPDGRLLAIENVPGTTIPVIGSASAEPERRLAEPSLDVQWAAPRWSPDGREVAAARWRAGGRYDVVILDAATGRVTAEITDDRAVDLTPAWATQRWVLFSSDRTGIANLYAYDRQDGRLWQVTSVLTGAFEPDVSPDGRWIAFAYYRADGFHVARIPFDPATWRPAPPVRAEVLGDDGDTARTASAAPTVSAGDARRYSPWRSLVPAAWTPVVYSNDEPLGTAFGAGVAGQDVVERHQYGLSAQVYPESGRWEAFGGWLYRGLGNPVVGGSAFQEWDSFGSVLGEDSTVVPTALLERERSASLVATFLRPRFRSFAWLSLGGNVRDRQRVWDDPALAEGEPILDPPPDVGAVATLGYSTTRAFDFSVSTEQGFVAAAQVEGRRFTRPIEGETERRGYFRATGRAQGYRGLDLGGFGKHVLAVRAAAGADFGTRSPGYRVGGNGGVGVAFPLYTGFTLSDDPVFPVRGYPSFAQTGDRAAAATAEYRFPLLLLERGVRTLPLFVDRFWGAAFADAGAAWCVEFCEPFFNAPAEPEPIYSLGAELGTDVLLGYIIPLRMRFGVAVPLREIEVQGGGRERPAPEFYFAIGQSF